MEVLVLNQVSTLKMMTHTDLAFTQVNTIPTTEMIEETTTNAMLIVDGRL